MMVVLPDPLVPTIRVSGGVNWMVSVLVLSKERMPKMDILSMDDMMGKQWWWCYFRMSVGLLPDMVICSSGCSLG
jgi:hypothetical protein